VHTALDLEEGLTYLNDSVAKSGPVQAMPGEERQ
jgi:hypothetical protein